MKNKGFTLIELIAVLVIMSIITLLATPNIISLMNKGKEDSFKSEVKSMVTKVIAKHKETDKSSFDMSYIRDSFDLPIKDPYGYTYSQFNVNFSYEPATENDGLPKPSSRLMNVIVNACKGSKCHCFTATNIKKVEELDDVNVSTNCGG